MKHIKIYESFTDEEIGQLTAPEKTQSSFETESTDINPIDDTEEGDYTVRFINADGEETTMSIGHALDPKYSGGEMTSIIEMIPGSSSDGREYFIEGYYTESESFRGAYNLVRAIIKE